MPIKVLNSGGAPMKFEGTATEEEVLQGNSFYSDDKNLKQGTMVNYGSILESIPINGTYEVPKGFHNGGGIVTQNIPTKGAATITPSTVNQTITSGVYLTGNQIIEGDADLIPSNIKAGVDIFGVVGNMASGTTIKNYFNITASLNSSTGKILFNLPATVNPSNCAIWVHGTYRRIGSSNFTAQTINPNSVELTYYTTGISGSFTLTLVEFDNVKSLQRGLISGSFSASNGVTINAVDTNKALVLGHAYEYGYKYGLGIYLVNSTTVSVHTSTSSPEGMWWNVIEFY